ncbi:DUF2889 domain-containing protein [Desulforhopalus singaporensis]|uniref:DUF2889 domain-containing protein n=1 Tax=Desulforhopalus singaporensis TaxID=91360 RepID=A0A1H0PSN6_9BACT|nr:DUF2889 domain-containing protein [Desulforhopalus singaporensis]SDP07556.1 Protein of unknown function [Desulforhopalus singaporensis]
MSFLERCQGENIHNRNMDISTYTWDAEHILLVGEFKEGQHVDYTNHLGEKITAGVYHHMKIELIVNISTMVIADVFVSMPQVPHEACRAMVTSLNPIKGMAIVKGFSSRVSKLVGGSKGCTHLVSLLMAMAPASLQGTWIDKSYKGISLTESAAGMETYLIGSCYVWRKDGSLAASLTERLRKESS